MSPLTPDPIPVPLVCPHCGKEYSHDAMLSGNTCGATFYSDGFFDNASMWVKEVVIIRCSQCKEFVWTRDMGTHVSSQEDGEIDLAWSPVSSATEPLTLQELAEALASGIAQDKNDERYLRFALWWQFNNRIRRIEYWTKVRHERKWQTLLRSEDEKKLWHENLTALFDLLDASDKSDRLIQAEIYREQGEFALAMEILDELNDELNDIDIQVKKEQLKQQAELYDEQDDEQEDIDRADIDQAHEILNEIYADTHILESIQILRPRCQDCDPFVIVVDGTVPSIYNDILCWGCFVIYLVVSVTILHILGKFVWWVFGW